jgi:hypothetical protein
MAILKKLELFRELNGYLGAGVFDAYGKMLGGVTEIAGVSFETAGSLFHDAFLFTRTISIEAGFGLTHSFQVNTETGIVFVKCYHEDEIHFHTILVVKHNTNIAMAKHMLTKVTFSLREEFEPPPLEDLPFPSL